MTRRAATHQIHVDASRGVVVKRFRSWDRREPAREWAALTLLAEFAPGLAATPISADLTAEPPVIEMSWLPGVPLGSAPLPAAQAEALVLALGRLWDAVPRTRLTDLGEPGMNVSQLACRATALLRTRHAVEGSAAVQRAREAGTRWLSAAALDVRGGGVVLGQGDSNLANFLWDGAQVRLVDFEDSGPSDRAFELAVLVEHISAWSEAGLPADEFLALFDLTVAERARVRECRRLAALFWLMMLLPGGPAHHRNPPGTVERQAARLLQLL
jgi:hypothetical protein